MAEATKLANGIKSPARGSTNWYEDLKTNWTALDSHLGNKDLHVTAGNKTAWTKTGADLAAHKADISVHLRDGDRETLTRADRTAESLTAHEADEAKHLAEGEREKWDAAAASAAGHAADAARHLTPEQAAAIAGAASDSAVVHLSGAETVSGTKSFANNAVVAHAGTTAGWFIDPSGLPKGGKPAETLTQCFRVRDSTGAVAAEFAAQEYNTGNRRAYIRVNDGSVDRRVHLLLTPAGACSFGPANGADGITLGDGSHKWAQINGVAPAALGFPYFSKAADLKAEIGEAALTEAGASYVSAEVGWLVLYAPGATRVTAGTGWWMDEGIERLVMPLPGGGQTVTIKVTGGKVSVAKFVPCLGRTDAAAALLEPDFEKPTFRLPPEDEGGE